MTRKRTVYLCGEKPTDALDKYRKFQIFLTLRCTHHSQTRDDVSLLCRSSSSLGAYTILIGSVALVYDVEGCGTGVTRVPKATCRF